MASSFGGVITSGIQDIAALLPLLGTEQCEDHVASALTKGYLYAAATPLSLFGSLGMVRAGVKTLVACMSFPRWNVNGAQLLSNAGFSGAGENLSLIMVDKEDRTRYLAEKRIKLLLKELHLESSVDRVTVSCSPLKWYFEMTVCTFIFSTMSLAPYVYLNVRGGSKLPDRVRWLFPAMRSICGFLVATMVQVLVQRRIVALAKGYIANLTREVNVTTHQEDIEAPYIARSGVDDSRGDTTKNVRPKEYRQQLELNRPVEAGESGVLDVICYVLLFFGSLGSVAGYIGCFNVVQNTSLPNGGLAWLGFECALATLRIFLWGMNPTRDDAPPLQFSLELDENPPLPTCFESCSYIESDWTDRTLSLVRGEEFLKSITSYTGLLKRFDFDNLSLYYDTLTRRDVFEPSSNETDVTGERALYITISDYTERTWRIYTRTAGTTKGRFFLADAPTIDLSHNILQTKVGLEIRTEDDPVMRDPKVYEALEEHHNSILDQLRYRSTEQGRMETVENGWTLSVIDTRSRLRDPTGAEQTEKAQEIDKMVNLELRGRDTAYADDKKCLDFGQLERTRHALLVERGKWISYYMSWVTTKMEEKVDVQKALGINVDEKQHHVNERLLLVERLEMECILDNEVILLQEKFQTRFDSMMMTISQRQQHLHKMWKTWVWQYLKQGARLSGERMEEARKELKKRVASIESSGFSGEVLSMWDNACVILEHIWGQICTHFWNEGTIGKLPFDAKYFALFRPPRWANSAMWESGRKEMARRIEREERDMKERLSTDGWHEFKADTYLVRLIHSDSKWIALPSWGWTNQMLRELEHNMSHIIFTGVYCPYTDQWKETIGRMTSLTSILWKGGIDSDEVEALARANPNILSITGMLLPLPEHVKSLLEDRISRLSETRKTAIVVQDMIIDYSEHLLGAGSITVRFFGPEFDLTLRLIHRSPLQGIEFSVERVGDEMKRITRPIPHGTSWAITDIPLSSNGQEPIDFQPQRPITIKITFGDYDHQLLDIQLLDRDESPYTFRPVVGE